MNVSIPGTPGSQQAFSALLDTGAQSTLISHRVVQSLNAQSVGVGTFLPANGKPQLAHQYRLRIDIPVGYPTQGGQSTSTFATGFVLDVLTLPFQPPNFDVLLGMDMVAHYHITMYNGMVVFSI